MNLPAKLHDGDLITIGTNKFVEYINTEGRKALRVTNALGHGVLLEGDEGKRLAEVVALALN